MKGILPRILKPYCNICGVEDVLFLKMRNGNDVCFECAERENLCDICGSIRLYAEQDPDEQAHYDEDCFK